MRQPPFYHPCKLGIACFYVLYVLPAQIETTYRLIIFKSYLVKQQILKPISKPSTPILQLLNSLNGFPS